MESKSFKQEELKKLRTYFLFFFEQLNLHIIKVNFCYLPKACLDGFSRKDLNQKSRCHSINVHK